MLDQAQSDSLRIIVELYNCRIVFIYFTMPFVPELDPFLFRALIGMGGIAVV
jgi:hypothetical protein